MSIHRVMVGRAGVESSSSPVLMTNHDTAARRKSATIVKLPVKSLPPLDDYTRACARLIWATFPAPSQRAVCSRAATETRLASSDTFDRILSGKTQRIDSYLMQAVKMLAHMRGVSIPPELAVRS